MQTKRRKRLPSCILCVVLIVAMALMTTGCNGKTKTPSASDGNHTSVQADGNVLGEGSRQFSLTVSDKEGNQTEFEIHTDQETVGAALQELELIDGEEGQYGLYVTTVNVLQPIMTKTACTGHFT